MKNLLYSNFIQIKNSSFKVFNNFCFLDDFVCHSFDNLSLKLINTNKKKFQNKLIGSQLSYLRRLLLTGVGFRIEKQTDNLLQLRLGYSHFLYVHLPEQINFFFSKKKILILKSMDLELLTLFISQLKKLKKFDKYKGKGFLNKNEIVVLKIGKKKK